ncbi:MAG: DUF1285 domain-containing protein [Gammaproteobacteria bacterium]|nr:DUF1285 domain-containing protein [Gammaproteobacteria bacterium]MCP5459907.1 DUF1285 domain-containing protein [Gammaproteobacteria bacterium]
MTLAAQVEGKKLPPVDRWNPPLSGDMDMRIARDGAWYHEGTAIERIQLARLFSTILRRDEDDCYYLVTPVEKWRIQVDDAPFVAVLLDVAGQGEGQCLCFTSNLGDRVEAGPEHPIEVEYKNADGTPAPYVHIRGRLRALISRSVFLELADLGEERGIDGERVYGVWSQGRFFALGTLEEDD